MIYIRTSGYDGQKALEKAKTIWSGERYVFTDRDFNKINREISGIKIISHNQMYRDWEEGDYLIIPEKFFCKELLDELICTDIAMDSVCVFFDNSLFPAEEFVYLEYLEYHVNDHCNLNCKSCSHFCPLVSKPVFANYDQVERDLKRLKELVRNIKKIRIMGGEPLLNKELVRYLKVTRETFPYSDIRLVTNGLLIKSIDESIWEGIKKYDVAIDISVYPPMIKQIDNCIWEIKEHGCRLGGLQPVTRFEKILHSPNTYNMDNTKSCICNNIRDGYIASCPMVFCGKYFNAHFDKHIPFESGKIDLYRIKSGKDLIKRLNTPFELCNYCRNYMMGINVSDEDDLWTNIKSINECRIEDWIK